jgi:SAM-dependent methyltransferase
MLLSFLMLFVELALIRWLGSNVLYLSYFSNFVLLGSFLGIGLGFLRSKAKFDTFIWAPVALAILVSFVRSFPVEINHSGSELLFFGKSTPSGLPTWVTLPIIFLLVAAIMTMIAEGVARTFATFEPLEAYRLDILGSLAGIVVFSLFSFLGLPPIGWGLLVGALFALLCSTELPRRLNVVQIFVLAFSILLLWGTLGTESLTPDQYWSPYYRITLSYLPSGIFLIDVNGIPHQRMEATAVRRETEPFFFLPYQHAASDSLDDVLIVGAGTGSDVAIAIGEGASRIDAVEIDPRLYELGKELHPEQPYSDPRVHVYIDDGRAFLQQTDRRYDLILFALPDSLTLIAGQSSLRLESYLFTREAMLEAKDHLKPDGVFAMYNYYREQWLVDRFAGTLAEVYGHPPCLDSFLANGGLAVLTTGLSQGSVSCATPWDPAGRVVPAPATDDHPFPYLKQQTIPGFYLVTIALILLASGLFVRLAGGPFRGMSSYLDLFFMGAAFLLLETKNVVQFALWFGTTWFVNALVFAGILTSVLAAISVASRVRFRRPDRLYLLLFVALVAAWAIPPEWLLSLSLVPRFVVAVLIAFMPIFLANLVFADRFRGVEASTIAFGANLLGAMVGGALEYSALVLGYRALIPVAGLLYGLAFVFSRRHSREGRLQPVLE